MLSPHYFHVKLDTAKGEIIQKTFQHGVGGYCALWVNVPIAPDTPGVSSTTRKRSTNGARGSRWRRLSGHLDDCRANRKLPQHQNLFHVVDSSPIVLHFSIAAARNR